MPTPRAKVQSKQVDSSPVGIGLAAPIGKEMGQTKKKPLVKKLIEQQRDLLVDSFENFDPKPLDELAHALAQCEGMVILTGVGKSAFVAQKIAMTLVSCGTKAIFLSPTDALHGDIGIVDEGDWVIAISRTGQSDELVQLVPFLKSRGVKFATFVGQSQNRLAQLSDIVVVTPFQRELGVLQMVPTTSAELQLIYGDILAVAVSQIKGITLETFARNHPAGQIGKRLTLRVKDFMLGGDQLPWAYGDQLVGEVLVELSNKRSGCLMIINTEQQLLGIFTDGDLRRSLQVHNKHALDMKLFDLMTKNPRTIEALSLAHDALVLMESDPKRPVTVLPVMERDRVVGLIRLHDLLQSGL